jgi:L-threonylcarbamoyladenylate synthase
MIVLVSDEKDILRYTAAPDLSIFDHLENDQRPTTVIYEGAIGLASNLVADDGSIAIRICREPFCRQLIKRFRKPVVSTSANISGESPPRIFRDISDDIIKGVDHVVKYRQDDDSTAIPSRIIRWKNGRVEVVRE